MTSIEPTDVESQPYWAGRYAMAWVLDDAPVPAKLVTTLFVIASKADESGKGSHQTVATIATKTGKSEGQVRRNIVQLRKIGLLLLGDQSLVEHLTPGQRPTVYDLPMHVRGPKPMQEPRHRPERLAPEGARRRPIPTHVRTAVFNRDGNACVKCGSTELLALDHIYPWCLGGPDTVENLRVLCWSCNSRKGARIEAND